MPGDFFNIEGDLDELDWYDDEWESACCDEDLEYGHRNLPSREEIIINGEHEFLIKDVREIDGDAVAFGMNIYDLRWDGRIYSAISSYWWHLVSRPCRGGCALPAGTFSAYADKIMAEKPWEGR